MPRSEMAQNIFENLQQRQAEILGRHYVATVRTKSDCNEISAHDLGYHTATGRCGTGWMAFDCSDIDEVAVAGRFDIHSAYEYADEWHQTLQYQYETKSFPQRIDATDTEDYIDKLTQFQSDWSNGYADGASHVWENDCSGSVWE